MRNEFELPVSVELVDEWREVVVDAKKSMKLLQEGYESIVYNPSGANVREQIAGYRAALRRIEELNGVKEQFEPRNVSLRRGQTEDLKDREPATRARIKEDDTIDVKNVDDARDTNEEDGSRVAYNEDDKDEVCDAFKEAWARGLDANIEMEKHSEERDAAAKKAEREAIADAFVKAERRAARKAEDKRADAARMSIEGSRANSKSDMLKWMSKQWRLFGDRKKDFEEKAGMEGLEKKDKETAVTAEEGAVTVWNNGFFLPRCCCMMAM